MSESRLSDFGGLCKRMPLHGEIWEKQHTVPSNGELIFSAYSAESLKEKCVKYHLGDNWKSDHDSSAVLLSKSTLKQKTKAREKDISSTKEHRLHSVCRNQLFYPYQKKVEGRWTLLVYRRYLKMNQSGNMNMAWF